VNHGEPSALAPLLAQQRAIHRTVPPRRRQVSVLFLDVVGWNLLPQTRREGIAFVGVAYAVAYLGPES